MNFILNADKTYHEKKCITCLSTHFIIYGNGFQVTLHNRRNMHSHKHRNSHRFFWEVRKQCVLHFNPTLYNSLVKYDHHIFDIQYGCAFIYSYRTCYNLCHYFSSQRPLVNEEHMTNNYEVPPWATLYILTADYFSET